MNGIICLSLKDNAAEIAKLSALNKLLLKNNLTLKPNDIERLISTKNAILQDLKRVEIIRFFIFLVKKEKCNFFITVLSTFLFSLSIELLQPLIMHLEVVILRI